MKPLNIILSMAAALLLTAAGADSSAELVGQWVMDPALVRGKVLKAHTGPDAKIVGHPEFRRVKGHSFAEFSGAGDSILVGELQKVRQLLPRRRLSVEAWVMVNRPLEWGGIIGAFEDNGGYEKGWLLGYRGNRFAFAVSTKGADDGDGRLTYLTAPQPFQPETWYHVVGVYDGKAVRLYINGKLAAQDTKSQHGEILYPPHGFLEIAAYHDDNEYFRLDGAVAEVRLYAAALSAAQVAQLFAAGRGLMAVSPPRLEMLAGPYLMHVTQHSMRIMWETAEPATSEVRCGPSAAALTARAVSDEPVAIHEVELTGLKAETTYFYQVRSVARSGAVARSKIYCFRTAVRRETPFAFAVIGDTRSYPKRYARMCDLIWGERPDFVVNVGDVVPDGRVKQQWIDQWLKPGAKLMAYVPYYVAIGNHERNAKWYYKYVSYPGRENFYSFDYGNAHFTVLDTEWPFHPGSEQYNWLQHDLASTKATWKFVFHHYPQYSTDSDDYGNMYTGPSDLGDLDTRVLVPVYEKYGVDMVFYGHIHDYERTWPLIGGRPVEKGGVIYVQTGGGGAELEDFGPHRSAFTAAVYRGWEFCLVTIHGRYLRMVVKDIEGRMVDWLELRK